MDIDRSARRVKLDVRSPDFYQDPYPYYQKLQEHCPVFYWSDHGLWTFSAHAEVDRILRDRNFGRNLDGRPLTDDLDSGEEAAAFFEADRFSLLNLEPPDHTRLRRLVNKAFITRQVESLRPWVSDLTHQYCDLLDNTLRTHGQVEFKSAFASPLPVRIIARLLGVFPGCENDLLTWSHAMVRMYEPERTVQIERNAGQAARQFIDFLDDVLKQKARQPGPDLLSQLLSVKEEGESLSRAEIISTVILLLNAGHEATVNVLGNGLVALLGNQDQLDLWKSSLHDPEIAGHAIEELLRFDTPLHMFNRWVLADTTIGNVDLKRGERVALLLGAANRDGSVFDEPHRLNLARVPNPHVSFGRGIHFCIGAPLARLELETIFPILLDRFPDLQLAKSPQITNTWHFRGFEEIWLTRQL